jgi:hypothetical protein
MKHLVADQEHRPIGKVKTLCGQLLPEITIGTPITDRQAGNSATQFAQLGKMSAKGTATVKHQHGIIPITIGDGCCHQSVHVNRHAAWRSIATACALFATTVMVLLGCTTGPAWADRVTTSETYNCNGESLTASMHTGAVDDLLIPNRSGNTLPGAFVVLRWQQQVLQLPRTNNAGPPSFSDGRWWWSLEDPDHPELRQRRSLGDVVQLSCELQR